MAEQAYQSLPINTSQPVIKQEPNSPSDSSSASDGNSTSSKPTRRRKQPSMSPNTAMLSGQPRESTRQRQKAKVMPARSREESSKGATMAMSGLLDQTGEVTYTPTTHRISKAKKGKKVHACEYPGCSKIFTRAEHRKRHEANHNTSPAFQCEIENCRKPFQRADLLARHMERQHNMPSAEASAFRSQYRQGSASEASSPSRASISAPSMPPPASAPAPSLPQPSGTMSIGSIIEPNMHRASYDSPSGGPSLHELSHAPIGTGPRSLPPDLFYDLTPSGDSPLYSSSDSCYSPLSDYLQPQAVAQQYYPHEVIQRPQSASLGSWPQQIIHQSPISSGAAPPIWGGYDPSEVEFAPEGACLPPQRPYVYHSPSWTDTHPMPPYEMDMHSQQPWPWTKVNF